MTTILKVRFFFCLWISEKKATFIPFNSISLAFSTFISSFFFSFYFCSLHTDSPFFRLHLYYSHAIYRIKYSSLTFPIRFKACYFYVFTFVVLLVDKAIHKKSLHIQWQKKIISIIFGALKFLYKKKKTHTHTAIETAFCSGKEVNIYPSHANCVQIEKYVLLMTVNGFNRA